MVRKFGARKGLADTALKTADAGYLTRRLVDVGQDLVITEPDCGTTDGIEVSAFKDGDDTVIPLEERLLGRAPVDDIKHPVTGEVIVKAGELVTERDLPKISATGLEHIKMRSVLTCNSKNGVCASAKLLACLLHSPSVNRVRSLPSVRSISVVLPPV